MTELMKDQHSSYFRGNVGVVLINNDGRILNACRKGLEDSWQMPQGGINESEEPVDAAKRELSEELGLDEQRLARLVEYVCEHPLWLGYQLPKFTSKHGRGQVQKWFLFRCCAKVCAHVGHQDPGINVGIGRQFPQPFDKIPAICNVFDDPAFFDSFQDYMMQGLRGIQSSTTWHFASPL